MPANYELNIDHQVIEVAAWDVVSLGDIEEYLVELSTAPSDLGRTIEYLDFGEVTDFVICPLGALQIARSYEKIVDRGLRGSVIYAPDDETYEIARMLISTFTAVCGELPDGYRLTRTPLAIKDVRSYLLGPDQPALSDSRIKPASTRRSLLESGRRRSAPRIPQSAPPSTYLPS